MNGSAEEILVVQEERFVYAAQPCGGWDEQAVVGADQRVPTLRHQGYGQAARPHPRVDHGHVHPKRHIGQRRRQHEGALCDVEGRYLVADVHDGRGGVDGEDHSLHRPHPFLAAAEIAG